MTFADFTSFVERIGMPGAILFVIALGVWKTARWLGSKILEPGVEKLQQMGDAHIQFLNENTRATQAGAISVSQVLANQGNYGPKIDELHEKLIPRPAGVSQQQVSAATPPSASQ